MSLYSHHIDERWKLSILKMALDACMFIFAKYLQNNFLREKKTHTREHILHHIIKYIIHFLFQSSFRRAKHKNDSYTFSAMDAHSKITLENGEKGGIFQRTDYNFLVNRFCTNRFYFLLFFFLFFSLILQIHFLNLQLYFHVNITKWFTLLP